MRAHVLTREVDGFEADLQRLGNVVAHVEIPLPVRIRVSRIRVSATVGAGQELITPVPRETGREPELLVDERCVRGIAQSIQCELIDTGIAGVVERDVAVDHRVVALQAESRLTEEVLEGHLDAVDIGFFLVDGL